MKIYSYMVKNKLWMFAAVLILQSFFLSAEIFITSYTNNIDFSDTPSALIMKGDNQDYKNIDFNDSDWNVISLPSNWGNIYPDYNGIVWYRIHLNFPKQLPVNALGISLGVITDTDETYFNGVLIGSSGTIEDPRDAAYDKERLYEIPTTLIIPGEDNVLAIKVKGLFPYLNGPYKGSFEIGEYSKLQSTLLSVDFTKLFFVVIYYLVAAYFLLFFVRRLEEKENFFFALFSLAMGTYFALRSQGKYLIGADFFTLKKIEYLILSLLVPLLVEFLLRYFKKKHTMVHYIYFGISLVNFSIFLFTNSFIFWDTYNQFIQLPIWILGIILSFIILLSNFKQEKDARLIFYSVVILLVTMINDILQNTGIYQFIWLTSYGFLFLVIAIAVILSSRFVRLNKEVEDLNINLENRVTKRTEELNNTVIDLELAKSETDNLLKNVQEGIFILDPNLNIGDHYSTMLTTIFGNNNLGGVNLVTFLSEFIDQKTAEQTKDFLEIALTKKLAEKRLNMLNPLDEIKIPFTIDDKLVEKFVRFKFTRIGEKGNYSHLLGTVEDITEEKLLKKKIIESEKMAQNEMQMLMGILHLNPNIVKIFLEEVEKDIAMVEKELNSARFTKDLHEVLNSVFRSVHSIKGNASVLGLEMFTQKAHKFEELIESLLKKENLIALDLLDLLYSIVGIKEALNQVTNIMGRLTGFHKEFGSKNKDLNNSDFIIKAVTELTSRVSKRESKSVETIFEKFSIPEDSNLDISIIKKIIIQLVKNAVTHGIESPEERDASGKNRKGKIIVSSNSDESGFKITVLDDGKGLQLEALRRKAIDQGSYSEAELNTWSNQKLARLLFTKGLSTQEETTIDAGRGMGMDIVRHEVSKAGGKISLSFIPNQQTKFTINFPKN